ncbi:MAG: acyl-CoA thioesterase II [Deltaproteobacteria bacterium]|nr:MAG: acyl-CoA thioesterase II [Deltaproteobacteria bacterium]
MTTALSALLEHLDLEPLEENLYRGQSQDLGWGRVYGGQILGQALSAASMTVPEDRPVHSLHAYFLLAGDVSRPVVYQVDRIRDGRSFTTRRVSAIQNGRAILTAAASFQVEEEAFDHQDEMPEVPAPDDVEDDRERYARYGDRVPSFVRDFVAAPGPFETRTVDPIDDPMHPSPAPARSMYWFRANGTLPERQHLHRNLLAYASDSNFLVTALKPHGVTWINPAIMVASLDHAMWFHRPFRLDEWLLYVIDAPSAYGARGLARGKIFSRDGRLVVSTAQEGLLRRRDRP